MKNDQPITIYRKDYTPYNYTVEGLQLTFKLSGDKTIVHSTAQYKRKESLEDDVTSLVLDGEELELKKVTLNGNDLTENDYKIDGQSLVLINPPEKFTLELETVIYPEKNSSLEGLYRSSGNYCTQCEAEGFRKITYYPDRPDVLTVFTTRIEADITSCPVMLSNGNLVETGLLEGNRHYAIWQDPFAKPCYLFALVAGDLVCIEDEFVTRSGRIVDLKIYVEERNKKKCDHAMVSLKKSMRWDEEVFGLEYDLDIYMIVAVDDFNMGAMENKGLNIFNSKYVLSTQESATDQDYLGIEGVIGHEYFHNWTGNRVTCRDWFQLSLKEGLTVFRDQQFSSDMNSRTVQRIDDVRLLKNFQFKEDGGPMAHPVRPDSFVEINNFYTATVYNKGAEVIRMMHTLLGEDKFRQGMDLYIERHDGEAVTCDDFVQAMEDASGIDLSQFKNWYSQAGTPVLRVKTKWDQETKIYKLVINQSCPQTPGQDVKLPYHMPIKIGLLGAEGRDLLGGEETILELKERQQQFTFQGIDQRPIVSFLRDFSAPVKVESFQSRKDLAHLAQYDKNLFNRWDAAARLASDIILEVTGQIGNKNAPHPDELFLSATSRSLNTEIEDMALLALSLQLPSETTLAQEMSVVHPESLHKAKKIVQKTIAENNKDRFLELYRALQDNGKYSIDPAAMAKRSLKNVCLSYLMKLDPLPGAIVDICHKQYEKCTNMTDTIGALSQLIHLDSQLTKDILADFYKRWQKDSLVLDKWFALQAMSSLPGTLNNVMALMNNSAFSISNPNKVRALIGTFCSANHYRFHSEDGLAYQFLARQIAELNHINPQIAARLVAPLVYWKRYDRKRQELMVNELEKIVTMKKISQDVHEIASKALAS